MTEISNLSHSYSRLDMFAKCPKRYYHQVIAKDVKDKTFDATAVGIRIHESMDNRLSVETPLISEAEKYEPLCRNVEQAEGYSQKLYEKELTIDADGNAVGWFDDDAWMRAKLDVLLIGDTHPTTILDWKTGRRRPQYMTFDQLELNAVMVWETYPEVDRINVAYVWLKEGTMDHRRGLNQKDHYDMYWEKFMTRIERIEQAVWADKWPARPSGLCPYCPAQSICPEGQRR